MKPKDFPEGEPASNEAVQKVIDLLDEWFWAIENGTANKRMPDPMGKRYTPAECDYLINYLDREAENELVSHPAYFSASRGMYEPPGFSRLKGLSREAFAQAVYTKKQELAGQFDTRNYGTFG